MNKTPALIASIFLVSVASEIKAQDLQTVKVDSSKVSVDTGVSLEKGDSVEVTNIAGEVFVNGNVVEGKGVKYEGKKNTKTSSNYFKYTKADEHSLVGFVNSDIHQYQVRKNVAVQAPVAGNLFFAFNDGAKHYGDNKGDFEVTFKVIKKEKIRSLPSEQKVEIKWTNKCDKPVNFNWINFDGREEKSDRFIEAGGTFDGVTYVGHVFRVRHASSMTDLGLIFVNPSSGDFEFVK